MSIRKQTILVICAVVIPFLIFSFIFPISNLSAHAASFRPQIKIINSAVPAPESIEDYTGEISWIENQKYRFQSGEEAVVEIDYDLTLFSKVLVNGNELVMNRDYTLESGSTVIILDQSYLNQLSVGSYSLVAYYLDGQTFSTNFEVVDNEDEDGSEDKSKDETDSDEEAVVVPNTGANTENGGLEINGWGGTLGSVAAVITIAFLVRLLRNIKFREVFKKRIVSLPKMTLQRKTNSSFSINHNKTKIISLCIGMVIIGVCIGSSLLNSKMQNEEATAVNVRQDTLSVSASNEEFVKTVDLADGDTFVLTSQIVTIDSATKNGYQLYISTDSNQYNDLSLDGNALADERISATSGTFSSPNKMEADSWGYALKNSVFGDNPSSESNWAGVPVLGSEDLIKSVNSATSAGDSTTVYYGFNLTNNLSDGSYRGSENSAVVYTAITNPIFEYEISYDCNGGIGSIQSQTKEAGVDTFLNGGASCSRDGYNLTGWNTAKDGSGTDYMLGGNYNTDTDLGLYAVWEAIPPEKESRTFVLKYDANGGSGAPDNQIITTTDLSATFLISSAQPTRDNYTFLGWSTDTEAVIVNYLPSSSIVVSEPTVTLYAVWEDSAPAVEEHTFVLRYDANGGLGAPNSQTVTTTANSATFIVDATIPVRSEHVFLGWSTNNGATVGSYLAGDSIIVSSPEVTLYAVWITEKTFTLKYDANGGSGAPADQTVTTIANNATFTINTSEPTRSGFIFKGWSTGSAATKASYQAGDSIVVTNTTTTLYAVWQVIEHAFTLKYDANGGSGVPVDQTVTTAANNVTFTISSTKPTRSGYTFKGWSLNKGATSATYQAGSTINTTTTTTILYAVWEVVPPVKVSKITISGTSTINLNSSGHNTTLTASVTPTNAANKSVTWSSSDNNVAKVSGSGVVTGVDAGTTTIVAKANDGSGVSASYTVTVNKKVIIIIGASQVARFGKDHADIKSYTDASSSNIYQKDNKTLNYVYLSGKSFDDQVGNRWTIAYDNIIKENSSHKAQTTFYVYFPMPGNGIKNFTCDQISNTNADIKGYAKNYNSKIMEARNAGYNVHGLVVSVQPVKPNQATGSNQSTTVANSNSKRCNAGYRSNFKYHKFNAAMKGVITNADYSYLKYVALFQDIMDTSDSSHYTFKDGWTSYSTVDGIHWDNPTAIKYLNAMLNKNSAL